MGNQGIKWSRDYLLFNSQDHLPLRNKPGVYRIRAFIDHKEPLSINRLGGVDPFGILHIGKSNNLGVRIRAFRQASEGLKASHHAGIEFKAWGFEKLIPRGNLRFDYFLTSTEQEALQCERYLHKEYRDKYLDRPPLDGTSGQSSE
jgi:hypothetical protein